MSVEIYRTDLQKSEVKEVSTSELFENTDHAIYVAKSFNHANQLTSGDKKYLWAVYFSALKENPDILRRYNPGDFIPLMLKNIRDRISQKDQQLFDLVDASNATLASVKYEFDKKQLAQVTFVFKNARKKSFEHTVSDLSPFLGSIVNCMFF